MVGKAGPVVVPLRSAVRPTSARAPATGHRMGAVHEVAARSSSATGVRRKRTPAGLDLGSDEEMAQDAPSPVSANHNKYCHFCQHVKVRASSMLACSIPECSRRFCEHCLLTHLAEEVDPCSSGSWVVVSGKKQWHCPICRKTCCCSVTNCPATHRHCKAYRYRRRRAELASKRLNPGAASAQGEASSSLDHTSSLLPDAAGLGDTMEALEAPSSTNSGAASGVPSAKRPRKSPSTSKTKARAPGGGVSTLSGPGFAGRAVRGGDGHGDGGRMIGAGLKMGQEQGQGDAEEHDVLSLHECAGDTDFMGQALTPRSRAAGGIDESRDVQRDPKPKGARERSWAGSQRQLGSMSRGAEPCHPMDWPDDRLDMGGYSEEEGDGTRFMTQILEPAQISGQMEASELRDLENVDLMFAQNDDGLTGSDDFEEALWLRRQYETVYNPQARKRAQSQSSTSSSIRDSEKNFADDASHSSDAARLPPDTARKAAKLAIEACASSSLGAETFDGKAEGERAGGVSSCHLGQGAAGAAALKTQAVSRSHMVEGKVVVPAPSKLAHARDTPEDGDKGKSEDTTAACSATPFSAASREAASREARHLPSRSTVMYEMV
eukprot:Tamp_03973.p1 GENE.Tamp_03973~~Tamp_03973.p1  ORF type:complete len:606 (+),score=81.93 Tamp_03973:301-2118(+)